MKPSLPVPSISFTDAAFRHRLTHGGGRGLALAKALGLTKGRTPDIVDATAGLGRDGFLLAHLGAKVTLIERAAPIHAALQRALDAARAADPLLAEPASRITLLMDDAITLLPDLAPETVYIDPMHPARTKSALVKQPMRDLRQIVGEDPDAGQLIRSALGCAQKRVAVKWPRLATLPDDLPKPSYELAGKTTRYVVFIR